MKQKLLKSFFNPRHVIFFLLIVFFSCKKENNSNPSTPVSTIDKSLIYGWWYNDPARTQVAEYKGRNFKNDGTMIADATNYGLGIGNYGSGNWQWSGDTLLMSGVGTIKALVRKMTKDSLYYDILNYSASVPVAKMYYHR